jgi:hypothetical protein
MIAVFEWIESCAVIWAGAAAFGGDLDSQRIALTDL